MKARPILFSGSMIRALLAGTKTQTRRIVKGSPVEMVCFIGRDNQPTGEFGFCATHTRVIDQSVLCPYGVPGDLLWAKERLARAADLWTYVADGTEVGWPARRDLASKRLDYAPSIHMPKIANRLTLEITDVRVERLQDISEADAIAEGIVPLEGAASGALWGVEAPGHRIEALTAVDAYRALWGAINGYASWDANPWVWAVSSAVHKANVDAVLAERVAA